MHTPWRHTPQRTHAPRAFVWDRPTISKQWGNESFISGITAACTADRDLLEVFLDIPDHSPRLDYELPVFRNVFPRNIFEKIRDGTYEGPSGLSVWLHSRNGKNTLRIHNELMSTKAFENALKLKRFVEDGCSNTDIRCIYLPNPHASTLGVLALTSPKQQAPIIARLLFKHLKRDASVCVDFGLGDKSFTLEFNVPFFAWKHGPTIQTDSRSTFDGEPLRKSHNLSFLSKACENPANFDYLHECHTSLVITGWSVNAWTAYCLNDTYFYEDDTDGNNEDTLKYYVNEDPSDDFNCDMDAISIGKLTADWTSLNDPREYFLLIFKCRMQRWTEEWAKIVHTVTDRIYAYLANPHIPLMRKKPTLGTADGHSEAVEMSESWVWKTTDLLTRLITALSKTVDSIRRFEARDSGLIIRPSYEGLPSRTETTLHKISSMVDELEGFLGELQDLKVAVENFKGQIGLHVAVDGSRAIILQHWNVTMLHIVSPVAISGSIMQSGVGFEPSLVCFLTLTIMLGAITWAMRPFLTWVAEKRTDRVNTPKPAISIVPEFQPREAVTTTGFDLSSLVRFSYRRNQREAGIRGEV